MSPENSTEDILAVLDEVKCNIWITAGDTPPIPLVSKVMQKRLLKVLQLPLLDHLLDASSVKHFPYTKTFDEAINDPFCYVVTPSPIRSLRPIPWSHGLIGAMDAVRLLPCVEGDGDLPPWISDWKEGDRIYSQFPISHVCVL